MDETVRSTGAAVPGMYLDETEFCSRYRVRPRTAQRWRTSGQGPKFVRLGPRAVRYRLADCESWAARQTFLSRADELSQQATA